MNYRFKIVGFLLLLVFCACQQNNEEEKVNPIFEMHLGGKLGIDFINELPVGLDLNIFNYMYYYNGGGLAIGDLNLDSLPDLIFTSNLGEEKVYLNKGNLEFIDISVEAGIDGGPNSWTNGASIADINGDGLLDVYLSQVGTYRELDCTNKLFICEGFNEEGIPTFSEQSEKYGLNFKGLSTQAGFFDYDLDGDLDMFLMNHSLHHNGTFGPRKKFEGLINETAGDRLYRNDGDHFVDVSAESGIISTVIGYGLGLAFGDVNLDGYPDIYIGNDFHENDYLYINQRNGTFKEEINQWIKHTSRFSMGVDIADINNDLFPDILSLDMLPEDPEILKRSEGEDALDIFQFKLNYGYNHQYAKNALQMNSGNQSFQEIAMYAGIHATDWSWSPLIFDFDADGKEDIFISNGIPKRMNDMDYIDFMSGNDLQFKIQFDQLEEKDLEAIGRIPEIKLKNKFYKQKEALKFEDLTAAILNEESGYSNSSMYSDLDGDGDLDVVTNNINGQPFIYENLSVKNNFLRIKLNGPDKNKNAIGAKVIIEVGETKKYKEVQQCRAFQSSSIEPIYFGLGEDIIQKVTVIWPDHRYAEIVNPQDNFIEITYSSDLPKFDFEKLKPNRALEIKDISESSDLQHLHSENDFVEFNREVLIPHATSVEGPALAVGDLNNDGRQDFFIGSAKNDTAAIYFQQANKSFKKYVPQIFADRRKSEEVDAQIADLDADGFPDILIATGGNEWRLNSQNSEPIIYFGTAHGEFVEEPDALKGLNCTGSGIETIDYDQDGKMDFILTARAVPWYYGQRPVSYLVRNEGNRKFEIAQNLNLGFVKGTALFENEIYLACEWDGIKRVKFDKGEVQIQDLTTEKGFWNTVLPIDIDKDGDIDFIAGNQGQNHRLKIKEQESIKMFYNDFDDNGTKEQVLSYPIGGRQIPFHNKRELEKQMPFLKKKFLKASDFAKASIDDVLPKEKMEEYLEANSFSSMLFINDGNENFQPKALPFQVQFSPINAIQICNLNDDDLPDLMLAGNFFHANVQMGRYDACEGIFLENKGKGNLEVVPFKGEKLDAQVKNILPISIANDVYFIVANNDDYIQLLTLSNTE